MSYAEKLSALKEGDEVTGKGILFGLIDEPTKAAVVKISSAGAKTLRLTYFGVYLADVFGQVDKTTDKVIWAGGK